VKFVVTAGPTREPLDPVRFISNRSSGRMGYALAAAAREEGHEVTLISGPVCLTSPRAVQFVAIRTSEEMHRAVVETVRGCDVLVMCAAVADYQPAEFIAQKMPKQRRPFSIKLIPTIDILASVASARRDFFVVGFAAETDDLEQRAREKLRTKNCDMIVANDVSRPDVGMETEENEVIILTREGAAERIARAKKEVLAGELIKKICVEAKKVLTKKW
jgi:phosphopantothenoylcysteine decarboxylase/phosphopantothenate--cysteine ligase